MYKNIIKRAIGCPGSLVFFWTGERRPPFQALFGSLLDMLETTPFLVPFCVNLAPKMKPRIIKKSTFWQLWGRWFSRSYFGRYFGCFLHAETFKNHTKNNGFEALVTFRKNCKKVLQNWSKMSSKSFKNLKKVFLERHRFLMLNFHCFGMTLGLQNHPKIKTWTSPTVPRVLLECLLDAPGAKKASQTQFLMV